MILRLLLTLLLAFAALASPAAAKGERVVFENVRILTMDDDGRVIESGHVVIDGAAIIAVGEGPAPDTAGTTVIDGAGATLMPGLADMHVHYWDDGDGILYLANGITTVRNLTGSTYNFRLDQAARDGKLMGPLVYTSGPLMDGDPPIRPGGLVITSPEQAIGAVRAQRAGGFPAVKLYEMLDADSYRAAVAEAQRLNMKVFSHTPAALTVFDLLDMKVDTIEHMDGYSSALVRDGFEATQRFAWAEEWANADPAKFAAMATRTRDSGVWSVPTFALSWGQGYSRDPDAFFARPEMRYLSASLKDGWRSAIESWLKRFHPYLEAERASKTGFVSALRQAGAPVLIGSEKTSGTIERARSADLVLVEGDPRTDLGVLKNPLGVMVSGYWYDRAALDKALEERAAKVTDGKAGY